MIILEEMQQYLENDKQELNGNHTMYLGEKDQ